MFSLHHLFCWVYLKELWLLFRKKTPTYSFAYAVQWLSRRTTMMMHSRSLLLTIFVFFRNYFRKPNSFASLELAKKIFTRFLERFTSSSSFYSLRHEHYSEDRRKAILGAYLHGSTHHTFIKSNSEMRKKKLLESVACFFVNWFVNIISPSAK